MRIAVYAGTFDPITNGHLDIIERAANLFDKVILAVAVVNYKQTMFTVEERYQMALDVVGNIPNVEVECFDGLLVDFCRQKRACSIIRGLRAISDFDREFQLALLNRQMNGEVDSVFFMADAKYLFISSRFIRNAAVLGGNIHGMVPESVEKILIEKFSDKNKRQGGEL